MEHMSELCTNFGVSLHRYGQGSHVFLWLCGTSSFFSLLLRMCFFPYFYVCVSIVCAALELWELAFFLLYISKSSAIAFFTCSARSFLRVQRKETPSGPQCCGEYSSPSPKRNLVCNSYWPLGCLLKIKSKSLWSDCNF